MTKIKNTLKRILERVTYLLNKNKRVSIRTKIFVFVGLFVILNIMINLIIVKFSINDIYLTLEKRELKKEYKLIKENYGNEDNLINILYEANNNGIKIKVLDSNYNILYTIFNDKMSTRFTELDLMILNRLGNNESEIVTLKNYEKSGYDLHLVGKINDNYVILSTSIESLKKDARTTVIILIITSLLTFTILTILSYFISRLFSKKINEIKEVTEDISNLKFSKKIEINSNDELGDLFDNVNKMSQKLQDSIKELESANLKLKNDLIEKEKQEKLRKQLIANISHEFKTPLTIISGYSQLMMDEVKGKENKENLEMIISESERLSGLVYEFLELSKLESGNVKLNNTRVDINELIKKKLKKFSVRIQDKNISVKESYAKDAIITIDEKQVTRVIENILTNSIKFCKNEMEIKVRTYVKEDYLVYEVYNSGSNIAEKEIENIFNSYYKDKSGRNKDGTGLGLTIVRAIVDLYNGKCEVSNTRNGVKFIIYLKNKK